MKDRRITEFRSIFRLNAYCDVPGGAFICHHLGHLIDRTVCLFIGRIVCLSHFAERENGQNGSGSICRVKVAPAGLALCMQHNISFLDRAPGKFSKYPAIVIAHSRTEGLCKSQDFCGHAILGCIGRAEALAHPLTLGVTASHGHRVEVGRGALKYLFICLRGTVHFHSRSVDEAFTLLVPGQLEHIECAGNCCIYNVDRSAHKIPAARHACRMHNIIHIEICKLISDIGI